MDGISARHVWSGGNIVFDSKAGGAVNYFYGNQLVQSGYGWYLYNAHGDVVQLTDDAGGVLRQYDYDPYGVQMQPGVEMATLAQLEQPEQEAEQPEEEIEQPEQTTEQPANQPIGTAPLGALPSLLEGTQAVSQPLPETASSARPESERTTSAEPEQPQNLPVKSLPVESIPAESLPEQPESIPEQPDEDAELPEEEQPELVIEAEPDLDENPIRYAGEYYDHESGYTYLRARYYDPEIGRFISQDPHWTHSNRIYGDNPGENPVPSIWAILQSTNLYVYTGNNPIVYVDPSGKIFMLVTGAIGAVVGGAIYSQVKYGEVRWQNVAAGAAIGGLVGLTGGAATAYLATGSTVASTSTILTGMGLAGGTTAAGSGGVVLWSGGQKLMDAAGQFATSNGYKTLEQTLSGKILLGIQNAANSALGQSRAYSLLSPLWDSASLRFVQGADSQVHVFLNSAEISDTSVFMRIEYQYLKEKGIEIIFHLVNGG